MKDQVSKNNADQAAEPASGGGSRRQRPHKRTRWWLVLGSLAVALTALGFFGPGVLRDYFVSRAETAIRLRDFEAAEKHLEMAAQFSPEDGEIAFLNARRARKAGRFDDFERSLTTARQLGYDRERCRREEWLVEAQSGMMAQAQQHLKELLDDQYGDSAEVAEAFANGYLLTGRPKEARLFLEGWEQDYPNDPQPKVLRGLMQEQAGDRAGAIARFREALELHPDHITAKLALADALNAEREFDEAIQLYQECAASTAHRQEALSKLGVSLRRDAQLERAYDVLQEAYELDPEDVSSLVELGRVEVLLQKYESAVEHLEEAVKSGRVGGDVLGLYANALRGVGRLEEAAEQAAIAEEANGMLAHAYDLTQQLDNAEDELKKRVKIGRILLKYGDQQEGLVWLYSALDREPTLRSAHAVLAEYYAELSVRQPRYRETAVRHQQMAGAFQLPVLTREL